MNVTLLFRLLSAHLLADFFLQNDLNSATL